jgi:hypothetical protein
MGTLSFQFRKLLIALGVNDNLLGCHAGNMACDPAASNPVSRPPEFKLAADAVTSVFAVSLVGLAHARGQAGRFLLQRSRQRLHPRLAGGDRFLALDEVPGVLDDGHVDHLAVDGDRADAFDQHLASAARTP